MEKPNQNALNLNDLDSLESHLLFLGVDDSDQPKISTEGRIQHKIDAKNIEMIKWSKLQSLIGDMLTQNGSCLYELRIYNTEIQNESISQILQNIKSISLSLQSTSEIVKMKQGLFGIFFEIFIQPKNNSNSSIVTKIKKKNEVKIGAFGEESSGKSTTLSVIINEKLDDGNGSMRKMNFRFQHEFQSGRTLSISHLIFGIDENGNKMNINNIPDKIPSASKLVNLYDMGGSEKAMKNTLSLISPDYIDYALLFVDVKQGITENTKILYVLNNSIHIPIITVITMTDTLSQENVKSFIQQLSQRIIEILGNSIQFMLIEKQEDIYTYIHNINDNLIPIIAISNVNGDNISLLTSLLSNLPNTLSRTIPMINNAFDDKGFDFISSPQSQFDVHEHFIVDGNTIIGGVVSKGRIRKGESYYFGPNKLGNYKLLTVESIHCKKQVVDVAFEGQFSSLCLIGKNYNVNEIRKGMCLLGTTVVPRAIRRFKADVWSIGTEIMKEVKYKSEPVVIINHIRQTCKIKKEKSNVDVSVEEGTNSELTKSTSRLTDIDEMDDGFRKKRRVKLGREKDDVFFISKHDKIELMFEFKNTPEYITEGSNVIINDSNIKAFGIVTKVFY